MDLVNYLESLPPIKLGRLYESPFTCLAVLRSLPPLAKQYVLRLLFLDICVPQALVASWAVPAAASKHEAALATLSRLQVLTGAALPEPAYRLHLAFQQHLRSALCAGLSGHLQAVPANVMAAAPSKSEIVNYADSQWEHLLLFLVGSSDMPPPAPPELHSASLDVASLLLSAGLIVKEEGSGRPTVTQAGFQFLLMDTYSQLWRLLREYIASAERQSSTELASVISFLLQLGFQGQSSIRAGALAPLELGIAAHMAQLGLLLAFHAGGEVWLCPTRLAVTMAGGAGASASSAEDGFVVAETNFRLYAYTSSPVRQAVLRLFVRCDVLLPNLFVGTITRESLAAALDSGVGAEQIVAYLRQHAHARVASRVPVVPGVVADQIRLWQRELQRLTAEPAVLYKKWESPALYRAAADFAQSIGARLLQDDVKQELVALAAAHDQMRAEIRSLKQKMGLD